MDMTKRKKYLRSTVHTGNDIEIQQFVNKKGQVVKEVHRLGKKRPINFLDQNNNINDYKIKGDGAKYWDIRDDKGRFVKRATEVRLAIITRKSQPSILDRAYDNLLEASNKKDDISLWIWFKTKFQQVLEVIKLK